MTTTFEDEKESVQKRLLETEPDAKNVVVEKAISSFAGSNVYYVHFDSERYDKCDCFYYAVVSGDDVQLLDTALDALDRLKEMLNARRNFWQRLNEFSLNQLIAAMIALGVTIVFVYLTVTQRTLPQEFTGIFGIIAGYYFGKNMNSD